MGFLKKAGIGVGVLILIGACFGNSDEGAAPDKEPTAAASEDVDAEVENVEAETETEAIVEESEPTQREVWLDNEDASGKRIQRVLARRLPAYQLPTDTTDAALASCDEIVAGKPLAKRLKKAGTRWSADPAQALVVLTVVADNVCPDVAMTHTTQVETKRKADARQARAQARKEAARQRQLAEQQSLNIYYENCTAVEEAGAAPIYAGDPGYSGDLDRDGDGVACEQ